MSWSVKGPLILYHGSGPLAVVLPFFASTLCPDCARARFCCFRRGQVIPCAQPANETDLWLRWTADREEHAALAMFQKSSVRLDGRGVYFAVEQQSGYTIVKADGVDKQSVGLTNLKLSQTLGKSPVCGVIAPTNAVPPTAIRTVDVVIAP